ncbi:YadA-like family protein, partial [Acinetobacter sp. Ac_5812]|uniref:YadA-like family protein n=1 Tax=Acinetobacter sp. Ac_5812 TaxID=1848937 RepID=UPI00148F56D8
RVTTEVGTLNTRVTNEVGTLNTRIDGVDTTIAGIDGRVTTNSNDIATLDGRVTTEVGTLNTRIGNEVAGLNTRVTNEVGTLNTRIDGVDTTIAGIDGRVTVNTNDIVALQNGLGNVSASAVIYDSAAKDTVTLQGTSGTKITNLQDATLDVNSKDAVTGKQLHATNNSITALDGRVTTEVGTLNTRVTNEVGTLNTRIDGVDTTIVGLDGRVTSNSNDIVTLDGRVTTEVGTLNTRIGNEVVGLNTRVTNEVGTLNTRIDGVDTTIASIDGRVTNNTNDIVALQNGLGNVSTSAVIYDSATKDTVTLQGTSGTKITNLRDATLDANSKDAVTGKQLHMTNINVTTLSDRVTTEVGNLNTALTAGLSNTLTDAKSYTDQQATTTLTTSKGYTDQQAVILDGKITTSANTINARIDGVDTRIGTEVATLDGKITANTTAISTLDGRVTTEVGNLNTALTAGLSNTLTDAKSYTDQQATTTLTTSKGYTDQQAVILDGKITTSANTINTRIDGVDTRIGTEVATLDGKITANTTAISTLDGRVTTEVGNLNTALTAGLSNTLTDAKSYADQQATTSLTTSKGYTDQQAVILDGKITTSANTINTRIDGVDTRIGTEVATLDGKITANTTAIGQNASAISALDGRVTINTNDIAALQNGLGNVSASAVIYDSTAKDMVTLQGTSGTKITNLKDATLSATSTDAVTGRQLHTVDGRITSEVDTLNTRIGYEVSGLDGKIMTNTNTINTRIDGVDTRIGTEVATLDNKIGQNTTAIGKNAIAVSTLDSRVTTEVGTLNTRIDGVDTTVASIDGRVTTNTNDIAALQNGLGNVSASAVIYDSAAKDAVTLQGATGTKITNLKDATLSATSTDAVTGRQLHAVDGRITTEVGTLNTRIGNEVTSLNTRIDTTNTTFVQTLGGGALWSNGVFTAPTFSIQGQVKNTVSDAFVAVDQQLGTIKTSVSDLKTHTEQQAVSNLNDAKNYTDQQTTTALNNAKNYTDQQTTTTLNDAKTYADQKAADGKAYTDQQTVSALNNAKTYADQKAADGKAYTDQQTTSVLNDAKSYADQKAASSLSGAKDYTDQQTASTLSTANGYTDSKIADVQTQLTASNQFVQVHGTVDAQAASATGENSVAIGANTVVTGDRSTAVGVGNQVSGNGSGAFGDPNIVSGNGSYVMGNDNKVTSDNTFVLGNNVNTDAKNAVVLGNDSESKRDNTVSVGAKGKERQVIHVADATEDTDAVNYKQLKATASSANSYTNERVNALNSAFQDYRMETEQRFQKVDERFNRQGAMTAAMMNMASSASSVKGQNRVGVGAGFQGQEQAVSIGYQRIINENTSLTIGGAFTKEESSGGVGVGFGW